MLKFWRKTGNATKTASNSAPSVIKCEAQKHEVQSPLQSLDDEGLCDLYDYEATREKSRLSKTFEETLADKNALNYFIQYMEARNASSYVYCCLDIELFKSEYCTLKRQSDSGSPLTNRSDHDSMSLSTDCDSLTCDLTSLNDYSTTEQAVDEKASEAATSLLKKYLSQEPKFPVNCPEELAKEISENVCNADRVQVGLDALHAHVTGIIKTEYFNAYLESDCYAKHQIDILTGGNAVLDDILYSETALFYFMEFLEQENKRELLEFWIAATNLQQQLNDQKDFFDPIEAQNDAVVLYDKYISLQAHCPLGFSDAVRLATEQSICGENGLVLNCFQLPLRIVERVLDKHYLKPFLTSQLFYKYLSELINTVQASGYSTNVVSNSCSQSDCSSEKSFSANAFLALELSSCERKREPPGMVTMSIDSRELYDPDALWKRKKAHRLSLGRVTELGKYVAEIEPEPDRKGFKLKEVVKKIVSLEEEERRKEEMAWRVAEMIVKDITDVTLNGSPP